MSSDVGDDTLGILSGLPFEPDGESIVFRGVLVAIDAFHVSLDVGGNRIDFDRDDVLEVLVIEADNRDTRFGRSDVQATLKQGARVASAHISAGPARRLPFAVASRRGDRPALGSTSYRERERSYLRQHGLSGE